MEDHGKPEGTGSRSAGQSPRPTQFQPFGSPHQASVSKWSKESNLTPNPQPEKPSALARETVASEGSTLESKPQSSNTPTSSTRTGSRSGPKAPVTEQPFNNTPPERSANRKWDPKEWKKVELDSDDEHMSLAVMMKLPHELSLLQEYLEAYGEFNRYLGHIASGPRHQGLLKNIFSTIKRLELCTARLGSLRQEKQRGNPEPCRMELAVEAISQRCRERGQHVWDVMDEKVDMTNEGERAVWVEKKGKVLRDVTMWMLEYLQGLDRSEEGWKAREVRAMKKAWVKRWRAYEKINTEDQKDAGWIMDVEQ